MTNAINSQLEYPTTTQSTPVEVRELKSGEEQLWDDFVRSSAAGTLCHLTGWTNIVENVLGHRCFKFVALRKGAITGVFPIGWIRNKIFGDCLVSLPLAVYGGICAEMKSRISAC